MFKNVTLVQNAAAGEIFEQLSQIGPGDVLVGISFPRYSQMAIHAVEYARDRAPTWWPSPTGRCRPFTGWPRYRCWCAAI